MKTVFMIWMEIAVMIVTVTLQFEMVTEIGRMFLN
jgi:hypothetical protein